MTRKGRVDWIDMAKFWGMLLVVAGHHEAFGDLGRSMIFFFSYAFVLFYDGDV